MTDKSAGRPEKRRTLRRVLAAVSFAVGAFLLTMVIWYTEMFDTSLAGLLFTIFIPQKGTAAGAVLDPVMDFGPTFLKVLCIYLLVLLLVCHRRLWAFAARKLFPGARWQRAQRIAERVVLLLGFLTLAVSPVFIFFHMDGPEYIRLVNSQTHLYEQEYVAPDSVALKAPAEKPNLIHLYLESMETTYASTEDGGIQPENYMPRLTRLARENISFSNTDRLGGIRSTDNTNWTMAALFAGTSGLPFAFPVAQNNMNKYTTFAPDLVTLGDILARDGYTQEFLCGSDGEYGGRALYFREHGNYAIYDLWKAREAGDIPEDYYVWWGFEDLKLFDIAKKELQRLSQAGQPFNLTILTVDAHHLGGYVCEACREEFEDTTANVIACTDRQVEDFVNWCREQSFGADTVMIINGDHPRMDTCLMGDLPFEERTVYNCFLNARCAPEGKTEFRTATMMDLFPTTLAAMGYEIEGDRLGIGVNLFSGRETLAERMGYEALNDELQKYSRYFVDHFAR